MQRPTRRPRIVHSSPCSTRVVVVLVGERRAATIPCAIRFVRWMRAKLFATTARTPRWSAANAACSRERALAVVVAADDDPAAPLLRPRREVGVEAAEHVARAGGDVRPDREPERAVGSHVAGRDVVGHLDQDRGPRSAAASGNGSGGGTMLPPFSSSIPRAVGAAGRRSGGRPSSGFDGGGVELRHARRARADRRSRRAARSPRRSRASRGRPGRPACRCGRGSCG